MWLLSVSVFVRSAIQASELVRFSMRPLFHPNKVAMDIPVHRGFIVFKIHSLHRFSTRSVIFRKVHLELCPLCQI